MGTDYDLIAEQYRRAKQQPWRAYIETFTLKMVLGNVADLSAIDFACGEGFYTRMLRQMGAAKVTGVDLSEKMIDLARASEAEQLLGIEYIVSDARYHKLGAEYDLVLAAYLLNYARNRTELDEMCGAIARCLNPGGRFVTVTASPACDYPTAPSYRKYGLEISVVGEFKEGAALSKRFHLDDGYFEIETYFLSTETHEQALRAAGFDQIRWHRPMLSSEGEAAYGREYWSDFMNHSPIIFLEGLRDRSA